MSRGLAEGQDGWSPVNKGKRSDCVSLSELGSYSALGFRQEVVVQMKRDGKKSMDFGVCF